MTYHIRLQWDKQLENDINNLKNNQKNDYSQIGPIVKDIFWHILCGKKILDY